MYRKYLFKIGEKSAVPIRLTPSHILCRLLEIQVSRKQGKYGKAENGSQCGGRGLDSRGWQTRVHTWRGWGRVNGLFPNGKYTPLKAKDRKDKMKETSQGMRRAKSQGKGEGKLWKGSKLFNHHCKYFYGGGSNDYTYLYLQDCCKYCLASCNSYC